MGFTPYGVSIRWQIKDNHLPHGQQAGVRPPRYLAGGMMRGRSQVLDRPRFSSPISDRAAPAAHPGANGSACACSPEAPAAAVAAVAAAAAAAVVAAAVAAAAAAAVAAAGAAAAAAAAAEAAG